jgi:hypothetical protein
MIQRCSACGMIYRNKAPFLDITEIWGVCKDCHMHFLEGIQRETGEIPTKGRTLGAGRDTGPPAAPQISKL